MKTKLTPTQIYDAKKRVLVTAPPEVKAVLNGTYKPTIKQQCTPLDYALKHGLKRFKPCGCIVNNYNDHKPYKQRCLIHKLQLDLISTWGDIKSGIFDFFWLKNYIQEAKK